MNLPELNPDQHWECPNCDQAHVTRDTAIPFHTCRGLRGLTAPFVQAGAKAKVIAVEREDYVGRERPQVDGEGRPVMSVVTVWTDSRGDEHQDCAFMAPAATGEVQAYGVD